MDAKKYDRQIELVDMGEAEELAVKMIMQEGALRFQEQVIVALKQQDLYEAIKVVKAVEIDF
jgi:hypothetical protein